MEIEFAQAAYQAYYRSMGDQMTPWADLPERVKQAWRDALAAVGVWRALRALPWGTP